LAVILGEKLQPEERLLETLLTQEDLKQEKNLIH
jgi:hypothetical protein